MKEESLNKKLNVGLTQAEVSEKTAAGQINGELSVKTKSYKQIAAGNLFSLYNLVNVILVIPIFLVGSYKNALFFFVVIWNFLIGFVQEVRAKKTIEKLSLLTEPKAHVLRDGKVSEIRIADVVLGDILKLKAGDQICADAVVLDGFCQVNESLLTGESAPVNKAAGDKLLSGSFLVSGKCMAEAACVGKESYAAKITAGAGYLKKSGSVIMRSVKLIVRSVAIALIPFTALLIWRQFFTIAQSTGSAVVAVCAAVSAMVPGGLVLLVSLVLAVSAIRLARHNTLVQDLYCVENLARVDVLCLDKTGTITEGNMKVERIVPLADGSGLDSLKQFALHIEDENSTINAIREYLGLSMEDSEAAVKNDAGNFGTIPFSSDRKWSLVYSAGGSYILGAAERILPSESDSHGSDNSEQISSGDTAFGCSENYVFEGASGLSENYLADIKSKIQEEERTKRVVVFAYSPKLPVYQSNTLSDSGSFSDSEYSTEVNFPEYNSAGGFDEYNIAAGTTDYNAVDGSSRYNTAGGGSWDNTSVVTTEYNTEVGVSGSDGKINYNCDINFRDGSTMPDYSPDAEVLPENITPLALIIIGDKVRENAPATLEYFREEGVSLKIISGDAPETISAVAKEAGLIDYDKYIDASELKTYEAIEAAVEKYSIFARVLPKQKLDIIKALKAHGHVPAMIGDGANDVLALKEADCSIAPGSGAEAARNVANMVLLDSDFSSLPLVLKEGRKSINNLQRSASLYLTKTTFAFILSIAFIIVSMSYPFENIQVTLFGAITIGIPSFLLAFEPNAERVREHFIRNVFRIAIPSGIMSAAAFISSALICHFALSATASQVGTVVTYIALIVGLIVVFNVCGRMNRWKWLLMAFLIAVAFLSCAFAAKLFSFTALSGSMWLVVAITGGIYFIVHTLAFRVILVRR